VNSPASAKESEMYLDSGRRRLLGFSALFAAPFHTPAKLKDVGENSKISRLRLSLDEHPPVKSVQSSLRRQLSSLSSRTNK
jgi:hypothetical protein